MAGGGNGSPGTLVTTDIALTAYYMIHGLELIDVRPVRGARGSLDCEFTLRDPDDKSGAMRIKYANSPEQAYDAQLRSLRKLIAEARRDFRR